MVGDPVKHGVGEDGVDGLAIGQRQRGEIGLADIGARVVAQLGPRLGDHVRRAVDGDHAPAREAVQQQARDAARPAAGVEDRLVSVQREPVEHRLRHGRLRTGQPVVGLGVPVSNASHQSAVVTGPPRSRSPS